MFDIGFAELLIIGVVALLVIGPERLPEAVRTASAWVNRIRRGFNDIKQEVQQELHNDAVMRDLRETGDSLRRETNALRNDLSSPFKELSEEGLLNKPRSEPEQPESKPEPAAKATEASTNTAASTDSDAPAEAGNSTEETPDSRRDD